MKKPSLAVVIPSYNGLPLLQKHLPEVIKHSPAKTKIIVVEDGGTDGTGEYLTKTYPQVAYLHHLQNRGFTRSVNLGFMAASADLIVLLNNDVSPQANYLSSAVRYFENEKLFAVTFNETSNSWPEVHFQGKLQYTRGVDKSKARYSAWASGGSAVFRSAIWKQLGGFDEIYSPGYWEDIDLGWRAWKAGYSIIWDPNARVIHQHESTFNLLNRQQLGLIKQRNELLFNWKNITDPGLRQEHQKYLFSYSLKHPGYLRVVLAALLLSHRISVTMITARTDKEVLSIVNQPVNVK